MFTKAETKSKGWRKTMIVALIGITCVAIGSQVFESYDNQDERAIVALSAYFQHLLDHREHNANQAVNIDKLIKEGVKNHEGTAKAFYKLEDAYISFKGENASKILKDKAKPAIDEGNKQLGDNVEWGKKSDEQTVNPEKVQKSFADTQQFQSEIAMMFPKSYTNIAMLRQDLIIHHFTLLNTIKDVELLATNTQDMLRKSIRKLDLRKKYVEGSGIKASTDEKIWNYQIKYTLQQLTESQERCQAIIEILKKLQKDTAITQDNIENEMAFMEVELKRDIARSNTRIEAMEKDIAGMKCEWWRALLTLGVACVKIQEAKDQLKTVQREFKDKLAVAERLLERLFYFEDLTKAASLLTHEATGLLEITKKLENRMGDTKRELEEDFTEEEVEDNLWDEDFANDFAERLYESLERLSNMCDETVADCIDRKARLEKALIWKDL